MALDQKRLQHLLAIARTGSLGKAASSLGVSQPALSTSIALLEKAVGGAVLVRSRKGAKLAPLGQTLLKHARAMELLLDRASKEAALSLADVGGPLVIGASPVAAASIVPAAILRMERTLPRLAVTVLEGVDDDLIARLTTGEIDVLISPLARGGAIPDIEETPLVRGPMTVIMRPANPLARHRVLKFDQLVGAEWVLPTPGSALRRRLEAVFLLAGVPLPAHTVATNSISGVKALVRRSDRVAIMAKEMAEPELKRKELAALPLADERFIQTLGMKRWKHHPISPTSARFMEVISEIARRSGGRKNQK